MELFSAQMIIIYFLYGLAFFTMAIVIASQGRKDSSFILAKPIWFLSGFGIFQAFAEWAKVTKLLYMYQITLLDIFTLHLIDALTVTISFTFLLLFGMHLVIASVGKYSRLKYLPILLAIAWAVKFILIDLIIIPTESFKIWNATSIAWARYLLAFPGSVLVSVGLILQLPTLKTLDLKSAYYSCLGAAITFAAYGFFSGLITFPVDFWPGNVLNSTTFLQFTGLPVQHFRVAMGLLMAYTIIKTINIFNVEQRRRLEEAEKLSVLMKERERFSIDLHDGVIQSVYAAGLMIKASQAMLKKEEKVNVNVYEKLENVNTRLNKTLTELRSYIKNLGKTSEDSLQRMLSNLILEFRNLSMMHIDLIDNLKGSLYLNKKQENNVFHIVQEALFNMIKHADATEGRIIIGESNNNIIIKIIDNGKGFDLQEYQKNNPESKGLTNMKVRAQNLGGVLTINTNEGQGTEVILRFED
ncbi:MAG: hypothetical protein APF76_15870 [Desulfitibacter sp. BRH_c19]|nr:MAG: hypothetical protein APF76_15870 [Desulfitibacter sp. BRH_c19]